MAKANNIMEDLIMQMIIKLLGGFAAMFITACLASLTTRFVKTFSDDRTSKIIGFLMLLFGIVGTAYVLLP